MLTIDLKHVIKGGTDYRGHNGRETLNFCQGRGMGLHSLHSSSESKFKLKEV